MKNAARITNKNRDAIEFAIVGNTMAMAEHKHNAPEENDADGNNGPRPEHVAKQKLHVLVFEYFHFCLVRGS